MKLASNIFIFLFVLVIFHEKSYSLTDHEIKKICKNKKRESSCIRNLQEKRFNLKQGNLVEIPVIPFKR